MIPKFLADFWHSSDISKNPTNDEIKLGNDKVLSELRAWKLYLLAHSRGVRWNLDYDLELYNGLTCSLKYSNICIFLNVNHFSGDQIAH